MKNDKRIRTLIAQRAARIMYEQSIQDYRLAKNKAITILGLDDKAPMPRNDEVQAALEEYVRVFKSQNQPQNLRKLRQTAKQAMIFFSDFEPRLVGAVLNGTADENCAVHLHVFADAPEEVIVFLINKNIPYTLKDRMVRYNDSKEQTISTLEFVVDNVPIEISIFPSNAIRQAPRSPVDGKPMKRMNLAGLEELLIQDN